jgi:TolB-like protein/DNA-binding winged helix-turn-helix (wHTH) protein/Tfp pilus assembly protein PilF
MSLETSAVRRFDGFVLDVAAHELRRQGTRIRLQEQPFQILNLLLDHAGEVVTREELRRKVWSSSVYVDFDHGLNNAIARLRDALGDDREAPRYIETLPRIGYRFVCHVDEPAAAPAPNDGHSVNDRDTPAPPPPAPLVTVRGRHGNPHLLLGAALILLGAAAVLLIGWAGHWRSAPVPADSAAGKGPALAVLPFANLSSDEENEHFADGLTEALVTKLAAIHGLKVVARTSSYRFKGRQESAGSIAQALHVSHLLEGSVSRAGNQLRITAQLIDARGDAHLWSQTFDRQAGDIFQIQDEIAFAVAAALKVSLLDADEFRIRSHGTSDPEAYRLYLIAQSHLLGRTRTPDPGLAKRALDAALARDPKFVAAHAALARYYFQRAWTTLSDTEQGARLGIAAADRAVELDPNSSEALEARANFGFWRYRFGGDYAAYVAAQSDMQRAINIDPSNADAFDDFGRAVLWNDPDFASSLLEQSIQLDLLCTGPNIMITVLLGSRGHLQTARERCEAVLKRLPEAAPCLMALATLDVYYGHFEPTIALMRASEKSIGGATRLQLWAVYMSLGDQAAAQKWLDFGPNAFEKVLSDAARFATDARYEQAFQVLEQHRNEYPLSHLLDFPTARFALIAGHAPKAREILEKRLPDVVSGVEPISARNLLPALDLATAQLRTGSGEDGRRLLARIAEYLDGPSALQLPLLTYERARVYALSGDAGAALRMLDRAYELGLRTTWALDLRPQSFLYVDPLDADPAFTALRKEPRFAHWRDRITTDNARQLAHLRTTDVPAMLARHSD